MSSSDTTGSRALWNWRLLLWGGVLTGWLFVPPLASTGAEPAPAASSPAAPHLEASVPPAAKESPKKTKGKKKAHAKKSQVEETQGKTCSHEKARAKAPPRAAS